MILDADFAKILRDAHEHRADVDRLIAILERLAGNAIRAPRAARAARKAAPRGRPRAAATPARVNGRRAAAPRPPTTRRKNVRPEIPLATQITGELANSDGLTATDLTARLVAAGWRTSSPSPVPIVRVALGKLMADKVIVVDKTGAIALYRLRDQVTAARAPRRRAAPAAAAGAER